MSVECTVAVIPAPPASYVISLTLVGRGQPPPKKEKKVQPSNYIGRLIPHNEIPPSPHPETPLNTKPPPKLPESSVDHQVLDYILFERSMVENQLSDELICLNIQGFDSKVMRNYMEGVIFLLAGKRRRYQVDSKCVFAFDLRNFELSLVGCLASISAQFSTCESCLGIMTNKLLKLENREKMQRIVNPADVKRCRADFQMDFPLEILKVNQYHHYHHPSQVPYPRCRCQTIQIPSKPDIVEVPGLSNLEVVSPQRTRPAVNYQIPPLLGTPEIENLTDLFFLLRSFSCFEPTRLHVCHSKTTTTIPGASQDPMILKKWSSKERKFKRKKAGRNLLFFYNIFWIYIHVSQISKIFLLFFTHKLACKYTNMLVYNLSCYMFLFYKFCISKNFT
ncbi:hypothetical protein VP01_2128g1 [Puccinia sorghi]|uniref:Uncharacterized protein n=1 Tax=Puccinia sorghi TaxID=27349 RepID=A0A0L6V9W4_9BASI|nr:hypothetical protein VP01_2128g1 [Puccinia sorghi]